jgi:hypothetical protein
MTKFLLACAACIGFLSGTAATADAKCYHFDKTDSDTYVCVGKNGSDSFDDRKKGKAILKKALGKDPGNVGSSSSSCHSNKGNCYDENGKKHRSLKGY